MKETSSENALGTTTKTREVYVQAHAKAFEACIKSRKSQRCSTTRELRSIDAVVL